MADQEWHPVEDLSHAQFYAPKEGDLHGVKAKGKKFILGFHQGAWQAADARCPHAGGNLAKGRMDESGAVICPLHRFEFDLQSGQCKNSGYFLETYPTKKERGRIWIQLPRKRFLGIF